MRATNEAGIEICFMNKETAEYRFSESSITHGTTNRIFTDSYNKCVKLGWHLLCKEHPLARFYFFTMSHARDNFFMRCIHAINILNPFYHKYMDILKLFKEIKEAQYNKLVNSI